MSDARAYHRRKKRLRLASILLQLTFLSSAALFIAGPAAAALERLTVSETTRRFLMVAGLFLAWQAALWPLRVLSGWRLEKDFSLLKQDFRGWLADQAKSLSLSGAVFVGGALLFYWTTENLPGQAWWCLGLLTFGFSAFFAALFPVWVLPLFFKTEPLPDGALKERLRRALALCGFPDLPLFVLKLGEKTVRENALLTGLGRTRRAMLSDTLLANYTDAETEMVLAHEAGHHALGHLPRSLLAEAVMALAGFWLLFRLFPAERLLDTAFFPALALLSYASGLASLPLANGLSRAHERGADRFALERYPDLETFRSLMGKLAARNLADPSPGRLEEFILYTHPSKARRLDHAERFLRGRLANSIRAV